MVWEMLQTQCLQVQGILHLLKVDWSSLETQTKEPPVTSKEVPRRWWPTLMTVAFGAAWLVTLRVDILTIAPRMLVVLALLALLIFPEANRKLRSALAWSCGIILCCLFVSGIVSAIAGDYVPGLDQLFVLGGIFALLELKPPQKKRVPASRIS